MRKRSGWKVKADPDFDSGFKNQGPYSESEIKFEGGGYNCPQPDIHRCRVRAATNQGWYETSSFISEFYFETSPTFYHSILKECQALCDKSEYCFFWSRGKKGIDDEICTFKTLEYWSPEQRADFDTGVKGQTTVEKNLKLQPMANSGKGDFICDAETPPH